MLEYVRDWLTSQIRDMASSDFESNSQDAMKNCISDFAFSKFIITENQFIVA